jgi:hypothetical protein
VSKSAVVIDAYHHQEQLNLWPCGLVARTMPDPLDRARRYRERAAECRKLARLATSPTTRAEYETLASHYEEIAEAELKLAEAQRQTEI